MPAPSEPSDAMAREDIAGFATQFCRAACVSNRYAEVKLSWPAIFALEQRDWADRAELAKVVTAAVARAHTERSPVIERRHVFPMRHAPDESLAEATQRFQEQYLRDALERENWNVSAVARALKTSRVHVYDLMKEFQIRRPRYRKRSEEPSSSGNA
jgi:DNA-binding NtrC family response regulator